MYIVETTPEKINSQPDDLGQLIAYDTKTMKFS